MNAIPARVAGVPRARGGDAAARAGGEPGGGRRARASPALEDAVFRVGGAQADRRPRLRHRAPCPRWRRSSGPGNAYVAEAKRQVRGRGGDRPGGGPERGRDPGRRDRATPGWVAADLLAQAEHGSGDETVVLVTTVDGAGGGGARGWSRSGVRRVANRASRPPRAARATARSCWCATSTEGIARRQRAGPRARRGDDARRRRPWPRGSWPAPCSSGRYAPVAVGDYGIGPNHVLPTGGAARATPRRSRCAISSGARAACALTPRGPARAWHRGRGARRRWPKASAATRRACSTRFER